MTTLRRSNTALSQNENWLRILSILVLLCIGGAGCGDNSIVLDIMLDGVPEGTNSLLLRASHNGTAYPNQQKIGSRFSYFTVSLPDTGSEKVVLEIQSQQGSGCTTATAQVQVQLGSERRYALHGLLVPLASPACTVTVEAYGPGVGRVVSDLTSEDGLPAIDCPGKCQATLAPSQRVVLNITVAPPWYFGGWAGACSGRRECEVVTDPEKPIRVVYNAITPPICSRDNWCWDNPLPTKLAIRDAFVAEPISQSFAIGDRGLLLSLRNGVWSSMPRFTESDLYGLNIGYRGTCRDSWAVGEGGDMYYCSVDQWTKIASGTSATLYSIFSNIAVGQSGTVLKCQTNSTPACVPIPSGTTNTLRKIYAGTAIGDNGTILSCSSTACTSAPSGTTKHLYGYYWSRDTDSWIVGQDGTILRKPVGGSWVTSPSPTQATLYSISLNGEWAAGANGTILRRNGSQWSLVDSGTTKTLYNISNTQWSWQRIDDVWAFGAEGTILKWDGVRWTQQQQDRGDPTQGKQLRVIGGSGVNDVWVLGDGGVLRWDGMRWSQVELPRPASLKAVWASAPDDVWLVGSEIFHWNGISFDIWPLPANCTDLQAIWGADRNNVWVFGCKNRIFLWKGLSAGWEAEAIPLSRSHPFPKLTGSNANNVWLSVGALYHRTEAGWVLETSTGSQYRDPAPRPIAAFGENEIWTTNGYETLYNRLAIGKYANGSTYWAWLPYDVSQSFTMSALWGSTSQKMWLVGETGVIRHWNGTAWYRLDSGLGGVDSSINLWDVWGAGPEDVWAVGDGGTILRYRP